MKLAIVIGHNRVKQGAVRGDTNQSEFLWNGDLAARIQDFAPDYDIDVRIFRRQPSGSYTEEIRRVYKQVDAWGATASMELHFNGAKSPDATGSEMLSSGTPNSMRLALCVQEEVVEALRLRDRGVKTRGGSDRGGQSLIAGRAPAILCEPFFGTSQLGLSATDEQREIDRLAHAYLRGADRAMNSFPRRNLDQSRTMKATEAQRKASNTASGAGVGAVIAQGAAEARETIEGLPLVGPLSDWLPALSMGLVLIAFVALVHSRIQTARIEAARIDDHERLNDGDMVHS